MINALQILICCTCQYLFAHCYITQSTDYREIYLAEYDDGLLPFHSCCISGLYDAHAFKHNVKCEIHIQILFGLHFRFEKLAV